MSIIYPLSLPAAPGFRSCRFTPREAVSAAASPFTGEQQVYLHQGQWWEVELTLPAMKRALAETWIASFLKLRGRYGTFLLGDPDGAVPRGAAGGTPQVQGGGQTGGVLATGGWTPSTAGVLKAGDYLQIGTGAGARLHKVLDDAASNGAGEASLQLWPNLRSTPPDGATLIVSHARGLFRLIEPVPWDADHVGTYGLTFACVEAI